MDFINTIVPIILVMVFIVWVWSVFGDPIRRFFEWFKEVLSPTKSRIENISELNLPKDLVYN